MRTMMIVSGINGFDLGDRRILLHIISGRLRGSEYRRCVEAEAKTRRIALWPKTRILRIHDRTRVEEGQPSIIVIALGMRMYS
jgi:hypothetical protein